MNKLVLDEEHHVASLPWTLCFAEETLVSDAVTIKGTYYLYVLLQYTQEVIEA